MRPVGVPAPKSVVWLHGEVHTPPLSHKARKEAGHRLRLLQLGALLSMPISRPMPGIGPRCHELRIVDADRNWRIVYRIDKDAIIIVEVFAKKTDQTPKAVLDACRARLAEFDSRAAQRNRGV
jgi:phage-related protein